MYVWSVHPKSGGRTHRIHDRARPQIFVAKFDPEKNRFLPDVTHTIHAAFFLSYSLLTTKLILKQSRCTTIFEFFSVFFSRRGWGLPHYRGFRMTLRHTTFVKTPLDGWSARRRKNRLMRAPTWQHRTRTTYIHARAGFKRTIPAREWP
jgi:hypothetical protein